MSNEANEAERTLRDLDALTVGTRRASRSVATGLPVVGWGIAWIVGFGAIDLLDGSIRIVVAIAAWVVGMALSWFPKGAVIRTGAETRMRWAWVAVLAASPFMLTAAQPETFAHAMLFLGSLWGLAMCLYGIATNDLPLAVVSGVGIAAAGVMGSIDDASSRLLPFGLAAGIPLLGLGLYRVLRGARRA